MGIEWSGVSWKCTWWVCVSRREKFLFPWALNPILTAGNSAHSSDKSLPELEPTKAITSGWGSWLKNHLPGGHLGQSPF